ncbi:MAG: M56 family metallopeptidase [Blastocatellia bacterium]
MVAMFEFLDRMVAVFELLDQLARPLLEALLNSLWQGMLIAALVWVLLRVMRTASATTRHAVWMTALLAISALPVISFLTSRGGGLIEGNQLSSKPAPPVARGSQPPVTVDFSVLDRELLLAIEGDKAAPIWSPIIQPASRATEARQLMMPENPFGQLLPLALLIAPAADAGARSLAQQWTDRLLNGRVPIVVICLWLVAVAVMLGRIAHSYGFIFRLRRRLELAPQPLCDRMRELAVSFDIRRGVHLFTSRQVSMPVTVGSLQPMIILPPDLDRSLTDGEFDSIVAHELAHIIRWDYLTNLLQRIVQAFLFFHPAVWLIGKQLMIERELACDDWAMKTCEPRRYANCLARLVEILNESKPRPAVRLAAAGILFGKHVITRRVEMILNRDRNRATAVSKPALLYAIGLALSFVVVCSLLQPVIAVPAGQKPARPAKKASKPAAPSQPRSQSAMPPATPAAEPDEFPGPPELADLPEPPIAVIAGTDWPDREDDLIKPPTPPAQPAQPSIATTPMAPIPPVAPWAQDGVTVTMPRPAPVPWPAPAPTIATALAEWGQDDRNKTPVIPEAELLGVLVDIVKKDADPKVREEALQGIYRFRSDAAINALIGLYDSMSDVKVKSQIIGYLIRRNGDNSKAIAKLTSIVKSEQNEDLRNRAIRYLGAVKGDDGANNLIQIYDGLQDQKAKLYVIQSLGANKSRKAVDKLIQIARNDSDPAVRQAAIRSLYGIDSRLYLDLLDGSRARIGVTIPEMNLSFPSLWGNVSGEINKRVWEEANERMQEKLDDFERRRQNFKFNEMDLEKLDEMIKKLDIELPKIQLKLKEIEDGKTIELRRQEISSIESQLRLHKSALTAQLAKQRASLGEANPKLLETQRRIEVIGKNLATARQLQRPQPRPAIRVMQPPAQPRVRAVSRASSN